jgi:membrane protease subunit (stomatin/prohibitin family)
MALFDKLAGEFIDTIEWNEATDSQSLAYRFPRYNNEINYGAKLVVPEGQVAAFVHRARRIPCCSAILGEPPR